MSGGRTASARRGGSRGSSGRGGAPKAVSGTVFCAGCGDEITAEFVEALGKAWHPRHLRCTHCGAQLGTADTLLVAHAGQPYCKRDFLELFGSKCAGCGRPIEHECLAVGKRKWHAECLRCAACDRAIDTSVGLCARGGEYFCKRCYLRDHTPKCCVCGASMMEFVHNKATNERFCKAHRDEPTCAACHRVIALTSVPEPMPHREYADGRKVCEECTATAVTDLEVAQEALSTIIAFFAGQGLKTLGHEAFAHLQVLLLDAEQMRQLARDSGKFHPCHPLGVTISEIKTTVRATTDVDDADVPAAWFFGGVTAALEAAKLQRQVRDGTFGEDSSDSSDESDGKEASGGAGGAGSGTGLPLTSKNSAKSMQLAEGGEDESDGGSGRATPGRAAPGGASTPGGSSVTAISMKKARDKLVTRETSVRAIAVVYGLPHTQMCAVIAHELCHALLNLKEFPYDLDEVVVEGLCELWKHKYLSHLESEGRADATFWIRRMNENLDPVYGKGFRLAAQALEEIPSLGDLLRHVRRHRTLHVAKGGGAGSSRASPSASRATSRSSTRRK